LIFLDEPTAGVDPVSRRIFWQMIYKLVKEGVTVFVTTHYMDEAESFDEISFIFNGKIIANGTPKKLIEKENVTSLDDVFIKYVQNYTNEKYVSSFDALKNLVRKDN